MDRIYKICRIGRMNWMDRIGQTGWTWGWALGKIQ
jgi:hypothetical protein